MSFKSLLTQKCNISRKVEAKDEHEIITISWNELYTDVACRIDYQAVTNPFLSVTPNGFVHGNDYQGFFNYDTDIQEGDRIYWSSIYLYARPINPVYGLRNKVHHLEVTFGLEET